MVVVVVYGGVRSLTYCYSYGKWIKYYYIGKS